MATYQKRNGRITAMVRIKPHPVKSKTFDTMRDAKAWAQELEVKLKNEKAQVYEHILLKDALTEYRDTVSIKKKSSIQEIQKINFVLKHMKCDIPLYSVDKMFLVGWREKRLEDVKGSTVQREFILLMGFFTWCVETKLWLSTNPVKEIQMPKSGNHRERVISHEEVEALSPFLNDDLRDIFHLALETGMRQAEICNLTWNRIYLDKSYLRLEITKNGKPREVPLSKRAKEILSARKDKGTGLVFGEYSTYRAGQDFYKARIKADLFGFTFHDARHTAATRIALKIQVLDLCKMFGWSNPKRAMTYYNPTASEIASRL